ncbi:hypothetical protein D3C73_1585070 [compost metagenome]
MLILAVEHRTDFEQGEIVVLTVSVILSHIDQTRQKAAAQYAAVFAHRHRQFHFMSAFARRREFAAGSFPDKRIAHRFLPSAMD